MATDTDKNAWVMRVLGFDPAAPGGAAADAPPASAPRNGAGTDGIAAWQAARSAALASLKALEGAFRAMKEPESDPAIILLRAIEANLTETPATLAQVQELERYISTDDIIVEAEHPNSFGFKVELREPLLRALAILRAEQDAAGQATGGRAR